MKAELVRLTGTEIDIKVVNGDRMHVLQWRRHMLRDDVLLDGKVQASSHGLWGREKVYGLVFGRDDEGEGGERVMLIVDSRTDQYNGYQTISGLRLEEADGPLIAYGSLDPKTLEKTLAKPGTFGEWLKKSMGMEW